MTRLNGLTILGVASKIKNIWRLLCILTNFWVLRAPKSWSKHFFQQFFNLFCSFQSFLQWCHGWNTKKALKWTKKVEKPKSCSKYTTESYMLPLCYYTCSVVVVMLTNKIILFFGHIQMISFIIFIFSVSWSCEYSSE